MGYSEIAVVLVVYSVLIPFHNDRNLINHQIHFKTILKDTLIKMVFHNKAIYVMCGVLVFTVVLYFLTHISD